MNPALDCWIVLSLLLPLLLAVFLGHDRKTAREFHIPLESFQTHWHLIGGTGKGKTTAIEAMLHQLLASRLEPACYVLVDRMGSFSFSLLRWMASRFCPQRVRDRLIYIEPSREEWIMPFNPLLHDTQAHGYFKVGRAVECILRAWASQNIEEMPRLARWVFNAFWAAAQLGLTIADCVHLLMPGSPHHAPLLNLLPAMLRAEWGEIIHARGAEASRILESSRNRLKPFFENFILCRMFGSRQSRFDALRFMREKRIVLVNLAPQNRISPQIADAIGGMMLNEILATARSLPLGVRFPTCIWLDEFQRFVGPDIQEAIPEVRQLGIRLVLSHQSFSQLLRGDVDLSSLIWQCQSRMMFGVQGEDADLLAYELASLTYDPRRIKDEHYTRRQLLKGHRIGLLSSWSESQAEAENWSKTVGTNWSAHQGGSHSKGRNASGSTHETRSYDPQGHPLGRAVAGGKTAGVTEADTQTSGTSQGGNQTDSKGGSVTNTTGHSLRETLIPEHEEFLELASRTYEQFDEQRVLWGKDVRSLLTGQALVRLVNDPTIYPVNVQRSAPGLLEWDVELLRKKAPHALEAIEQLVEQNFAQEFFLSPRAIELETEERLQALLHPVIRLESQSEPAANQLPAPSADANPFAE